MLRDAPPHVSYRQLHPQPEHPLNIRRTSVLLLAGAASTFAAVHLMRGTSTAPSTPPRKVSVDPNVRTERGSLERRVRVIDEKIAASQGDRVLLTIERDAIKAFLEGPAAIDLVLSQRIRREDPMVHQIVFQAMKGGLNGVRSSIDDLHAVLAREHPPQKMAEHMQRAIGVLRNLERAFTLEAMPSLPKFTTPGFQTGPVVDGHGNVIG